MKTQIFLVMMAIQSCQLKRKKPKENLDELITTSSNNCQFFLHKQFSKDIPKVSFIKHQSKNAYAEDKTIIFVDGWQRYASGKSTKTMAAALLHRYQTVVVMNVSVVFKTGYVDSVKSVRPLSRQLFEYIEKIVDRGTTLPSIHLIGFSLGAHVVSFAAQVYYATHKSKVSRVTALDPARPCFTGISKDDFSSAAQFVHVVHTSRWRLLGLLEPLGHVDVYCFDPNTGFLELDIIADHSRAWQLYARLVKTYKPVIARQCVNHNEALEIRCSGPNTEVGTRVNKTVRGIYLYLLTDEDKKRLHGHKYNRPVHKQKKPGYKQNKPGHKQSKPGHKQKKPGHKQKKLPAYKQKKLSAHKQKKLTAHKHRHRGS